MVTEETLLLGSQFRDAQRTLGAISGPASCRGLLSQGPKLVCGGGKLGSYEDHKSHQEPPQLCSSFSEDVPQILKSVST